MVIDTLPLISLLFCLAFTCCWMANILVGELFWRRDTLAREQEQIIWLSGKITVSAKPPEPAPPAPLLPRVKGITMDTVTHECAISFCTARIALNRLMCARHWHRVPTALQKRVWETYITGQETNLRVITPEYLTAFTNAVAAVESKYGERDLSTERHPTRPVQSSF